jgi:hypothetical protein
MNARLGWMVSVVAAIALASGGGLLAPNLAWAPPDPNLSGQATVRVEVVAAGEDFGLSPDPAEFEILYQADGDTAATFGADDLQTAGGDQCLGVGALCTGDVPVIVLTNGSSLSVRITQGPADRLPVFSGDCDGAAFVSNETHGTLEVAVDEQRTCRITFVRPDDGSVVGSDTALFVDKTFDYDSRGAGLPDGTIELHAASEGFPLASTSVGQMRDSSSPGAACPLLAQRPQCEWAVTFDYDDYALPFFVTESIDPDWIPIFGGDCDARGRLPIDFDFGGKLLRCDVHDVQLEEQTGPDRNAVLRVEVVAPDAASSAGDATIAVESFDAGQLASIQSNAMLEPDGLPCAGLGPVVCSGDVGVEVDPDPRGSQTSRFIVSVEVAPPGSTASFSGACDASGETVLGVGDLATCRVTFASPADLTDPTVTITTPPEGAVYARDDVVLADFACTDELGGSGIATCAGDVAAGAAIDTATLGSHTFTVTGEDSAGNMATVTHHYSVADETDPTVTITVPQDSAVYVLGQVVLADYACTEEHGGSGLASCVGDVLDGAGIDTGSVGAKSFTVEATDNAGNSTTVTHAYSVAYDFSGFFAPVDNAPVVNLAKAGSAIPVKFSLSGNRGLSILAAGYPISRQISCLTSDPLDSIEETVTAGFSSLSYDPATDRYVYVWKTNKAWAGTCRQLIVQLIDGTSHVAYFKLK